MKILENVPLKTYSTMNLGGKARFLTEVNEAKELPEIMAWAEENHTPIMVIGTGSNIVWSDDGYKGLIVVNKIMGFEANVQDEESAYITIGAGENWDSVVKRTVGMGLSGIEQLSKIPGTAGATPVQNVGAYGREIADVLVTIQAYDKKTKHLVTIPKSECEFGYRTSRFKTKDKGRFIITNISLFLTKTNPEPPFYASLQAYFDEHGITEFTPSAVREAVIAIRKIKLPDPSEVANNGSFFANPIVSEGQFKKLQAKHPGIISWDLDNGQVKLSAGWLVEHAGFKDFHDPETGMATWKYQALVFVNEKAHSTADLLKFKQKIVDAVHDKFGITLIQEPEFIQ